MLELEHVSIAYAEHQVVSDVSFKLEAGQIGCLLGPSGCGKTSLLRAICGFEPVQGGKVWLRGNEVSSQQVMLAPEKRNIAVVFQDFALFPHLTVAKNIAFGLLKQTNTQKAQRVSELLQLIGLPDIGERYIHSLSGGQQQRVALARALANKPDVLLLDEPFSSLDAELREGLAADIRQILKSQGITALMVTHDQHEAFNMADVIGVLQQGKLHQWDTAYALYHQPATRFVADFVGQGAMLNAVVDQSRQLKTALGTFATEQVFTPGHQLQILVRPDDILHDDTSTVTAKVESKAFRGSHILYKLTLDNGESVLCLAPSHHDHEIGFTFGIRLDIEHLIFFELDQSYSVSL